MKKFMLLLVLALAVCLLAIPVGAETENHPHNGSHCVCGGSAVGNHDHVCADIAWQALPTDTKNFSNLKSGNYYLTQDLTITAISNVQGLQLTICLNGYDINTTAGAVFGYVKPGCVINFCDCSGVQAEDGSWTWGGTVTANRAGNARDFGGIANFQANTISNIYGGNFVGAEGGKAANGGVFNVCNDAYATAGGTSTTDSTLFTRMNIYNGHFYGGSVTKTGGAINCWHSVTLNLYGGIIDGGKAGTSGSVIASSSASAKITIDGTIIRNGEPGSVMIMNGTKFVSQQTTLEAALSKVKDGQYLRLTGPIDENVTIPAGVIIDLAGNTLSGVTVSSGAQFMDSATDGYTSLHYGKLIPAAGAVEASYKTNTGAIKRYLTIEENGSYSFHRFYMGITKISINPSSVGVGYKAQFVGSEYLEQYLSAGNAFGYSLWLEGGNKLRRGLTADKFSGAQELTLRINNFLKTSLSTQENAARSTTPIYASAYVRLKDGTVVETDPVGYNFKEMTELANASYSKFNASQQKALQSLSDKFSASMINWDVDSFHHSDDSVWKKMSNADFNAMVKKSTTIPAGHYVLTEDVTVKNTSALRIKDSVSICLNGHTLTISNRFNTYSTFNICDCHAENKEGGITSVENVDHAGGKKNYGAVMYCYYNSVINHYGGNLTCTGSLTHGGVIATSHDGGESHADAPAAVYNMYGGSIYGGNVISNGGNIILFNKSTFNLYDGKIYGGSATNGGNIQVGSNCFLNVYGGTITGGTATEGSGGNIQCTGNLNIYGGTISGGTAKTEASYSSKGGNIYVTGLANVENATIKNGTATGMGGNIYSATKKLTIKDTTISGGKVSKVTKDGETVYQTGLGKDIFTTFDGLELIGDVQIADLYVAQQGSVNAHDLSADAKIHVNMDTLGPVSQDANMASRFTTDMKNVKFVNHNGYTTILPSDTSVSGILTQDDTFRVGYSMVSINTTEKGLTMSNWGNPNGRYTDGTYNYELMATTVAVTDKENNTFLMITVDLQNPPHAVHPQLFKRIEELTGVPAENIIITATHTHNAPTSSASAPGNQNYRIFLFNQLVKGAMEAMADRAPATMKTGSFDTVGMNWSRHYYYYKNNDKTTEKIYYGDQFGQAPKNGETSYHVRNGDTTMHMVSFERTGKQPIIIVNWRAHPHRSGGREKVTLDADVIGATREYMHSKTNYLFAYYQGAAGNMNTTSRLSGETYKSGKIKEFGNELGRQLVNGMNKLKPAETGLIECTKVLYDAEVDHTQDDKYEQAVALKDYYYANPVEMNVYENQIAKAAEFGFTSVFHATRLITKYELGATKELELNIFSIGDSFAFYTAPAELWDSFSEETEALSPFPMTFTIGYCNGGVAYIPYKLDYYVAYEYFYCLFKQDDVINRMQDYYLEHLNKQFGN